MNRAPGNDEQDPRRIAHELNNLLTRILGHTDLASTKLESGSPALSDLTKVRRAALEASELTRRLRDLGRARQAGGEGDPTPDQRMP